jgi:hypothetical protein
MHYDGPQTFDGLGWMVDLYTCQTELCIRKDFTMSYNKRAVEGK